MSRWYDNKTTRKYFSSKINYRTYAQTLSVGYTQRTLPSQIVENLLPCVSPMSKGGIPYCRSRTLCKVLLQNAEKIRRRSDKYIATEN